MPKLAVLAPWSPDFKDNSIVQERFSKPQNEFNKLFTYW
jgi:hypothetical protein